MTQAGNKKTISLETWEQKLAGVRVPKEDMNRLVMNFLVTEVRLVVEDCAELDEDIGPGSGDCEGVGPLGDTRVVQHTGFG